MLVVDARGSAVDDQEARHGTALPDTTGRRSRLLEGSRGAKDGRREREEEEQQSSRARGEGVEDGVWEKAGPAEERRRWTGTLALVFAWWCPGPGRDFCMRQGQTAPPATTAVHQIRLPTRPWTLAAEP